jgi:two-component system sensor histidine kinase DesK
VPGTGLLGLRERAEAVGARLETRALEPHGFELAVVAVRPPGRTSSAGTPEAPERVDA